ncbi:MAG: hypothetical protein CVV10_09380, partial [Gammaproteobacteria bacterium HGW-Gammaproteobacteria-14]
MCSLKFCAEQQNFSESILRSNQIPHAFVKGEALAGCYYDEPGERFCRDIDLLVHGENLVQVAELAQQGGYRVFPNRELLSRQDLHAAARFYPVISLFGPNQILIEVHSELDKTSQIFDTASLLDTVQSRTLHGHQLSVLPLSQHFVFVCLHSTRHLWSHLSWLVDIDAMVRHE